MADRGQYFDLSEIQPQFVFQPTLSFLLITPSFDFPSLSSRVDVFRRGRLIWRPKVERLSHELP
jgi:hypothetical protein